MIKGKILIVRIDEDGHRTAFALAREIGTSVSTLVRHLILKEAEQRNSAARNSNASVVRQDLTAGIAR